MGLAWVSIAMIAAPGPAAWVALSGDDGDAGLFFAVFSLSSAAGAALGGRAIDRFGRRRALAGAHVLTAAGFAGAGLSYVSGALLPFAVSTAALALGVGASFLTRVVAAGLFPPAGRARAVAVIQVSATFGAILGPLLLVLSDPLASALGRSADGFVWFLAPPLYLACAALVALAPDAPADTTPPTGAPHDATRTPRRPFAAGVVTLVCAQGAMVAVMGVAGAALHAADHSTTTTGLVMVAHFLGMFALSLVVGRVAHTAGRRPTILGGSALLAAGGAIVAVVHGPWGLAGGLFLIGLGWSFAYIGGTVLLTDVVPAARRASVIGMVDLATALGAAAASFGGGWWYGRAGLEGLGRVAIAVVLVPVAFAMALRERSPGHYGALVRLS